MMKSSLRALYKSLTGIVVTLSVACVPVASAAAATPSPTIKEAQTIIDGFGIPVGPIDGLDGPNTAQGYCAFRYVAGMTPSRAPLDSTLLSTLRTYHQKYATGHDIPKRFRSDGVGTYVVVDQTCQTMFIYYTGILWAVFPASTGRPGLETPNGLYSLGDTVKGWSCSTEYPETCQHFPQGKYDSVSDFGNMYNKRPFKAGGFTVHGSNTVRTYPSSAGCVRIDVVWADWLTDNIPAGTRLVIQGNYWQGYQSTAAIRAVTPQAARAMAAGSRVATSGSGAVK